MVSFVALKPVIARPVAIVRSVRLTAVAFAVGLALLTGCATVTPPPEMVEAPVSRADQLAAQAAAMKPVEKTLKRKVAIGRFSNETRYGRSLLRDDDLDPLGKQVSDMLSNRLVESQKFMVFERPDLSKLQAEQELAGAKANLIGVDALILGSLTEFGRATTGKAGFLSSTKVQTAKATVEVRLADPRTGHVFFSATGRGAADTESGNVAGWGSKAGYDATLNDKAIAAAISNLIGALVGKLEERPWRTDILQVEGDQLFISGGGRQGLKVGDSLAIMKAGKTIRSAQTGFDIELPATPSGTAQVVTFFGDSEANEGSVISLTTGVLPTEIDGLFVAEIKGGSQ